MVLCVILNRRQVWYAFNAGHYTTFCKFSDLWLNHALGPKLHRSQWVRPFSR